MLFPRSGSRRRAPLAVLSATAIAVSALVGVPAAAAQSGSRDLGVDEISHSRNMKQVAHIPKQPPFNNRDAFGTDIAFQGDHAFVGNYGGFVIYDISKPRKPEIVSQVHCPGGQNDVSVTGDLLFLSTDYPRSNNSCTSTSASASDPGAWEGIKVFDVSDLSSPRYVSAVETACGSHTHTLVPDKARAQAYIYVSSYGPSEKFPGCQPPHDQVSIVGVPYDNPEQASIVDEPVLFPEGGNPGQDGEFPDYTSATTGCHDLTAYPEKDLMAGACMGDGVLIDISDRQQPHVIDRVQDNKNFAFWHSATFNNDASKVVFTDELGGGAAATCNADVGSTRGANGIYDITGSGDDRNLVFRSYYKIPRHQADTENCVAHNGSLIPVKGSDLMVQAWYQGGVSVWDFTDSSNPHEIGYWERGPLSNDELVIGGSWSAYYYNGYIYSSDIQKGLDVLRITDPRTVRARSVQMDKLNTQTQYDYYQ